MSRQENEPACSQCRADSSLNGVTILDDIVAYDFEKFVHIMDTEGNKIELWEPIESK